MCLFPFQYFPSIPLLQQTEQVEKTDSEEEEYEDEEEDDVFAVSRCLVPEGSLGLD